MAKHDTVLNTKTVEYEISSAAYESDATEICLFPNNTDNTTMKYDFEYQGTDVYFKVNIYNRLTAVGPGAESTAPIKVDNGQFEVKLPKLRCRYFMLQQNKI